MTITTCRRSLIAVALAAAACTGTDTGNPYQQPLSVDAHSSDSDAFAVTVAAGGGVVAEAWLSIGHMAFLREGDPRCDLGAGGLPDDNDALDLGVADHAVAGSTRVDITLTAGDFCTLAIPLGVSLQPLPAGAPDELESASVVLIGRTAAGTDFVIASPLEITLTLRGDGALALEPELGPLFLGFDVARWLQDVDIDGAAAGGTVIIDAVTNTGLLFDFESNVGAGVELYADADGNGAVDPGDERLAAGR